ncbi:glycosyltransferase [Mesorhizobium sp. C420B]|uniref:glycosyltransferase n=1 Tax=unclassified Mesorhizobium TaxID=325217 RepID=UPI0004CE050F|nr:glycosyltransferase [Mesorhizobium sp. LSHC420B00]
MADRLFFATLDDDLFSFVSIALQRAVHRRATVALFLGPQSCFGAFSFKRYIKRSIFAVLKQVPRVTIASIIPFSLAPEYRTIVNIGLYDPQWWDMHDGSALKQPGDTSVATRVHEMAGGRPIVCWLGAASVRKGFAFLVDILEANPDIAKQVCFIFAGVGNTEQTLASRFNAAGGIQIDRRLTDGEWQSLYGVADAVWACYEPMYDQASGVFGRALQFGVPAIVRRGSLIHTAATKLDASVFPLDFGDCRAAATALRKISNLNRSISTTVERNAMIGSWRNNFISAALRGLNGAADMGGRRHRGN